MLHVYIYIYIHIYVCITIIIFMYITIVSVFVTYSSTIIVRHKYEALHSAKGGAAETGCSGLHSIIGCFTIQHYPHPLHPPPTATPLCRVSRGTIWSILYYTIWYSIILCHLLYVITAPVGGPWYYNIVAILLQSILLRIIIIIILLS